MGETSVEVESRCCDARSEGMLLKGRERALQGQGELAEGSTVIGRFKIFVRLLVL